MVPKLVLGAWGDMWRRFCIHMHRTIFAHVDAGPSRGSIVRRHGSEDPHRREPKFGFFLIFNNSVYVCRDKYSDEWKGDYDEILVINLDQQSSNNIANTSDETKMSFFVLAAPYDFI